MRSLPILALAVGCATSRAPAAAPTLSPVFGLHAGEPANYSLALGSALVYFRRIDSADRRAHTDRAVFVVAEPGWNAGRVSAGSGVAYHRFRSTTLLNVRATALRRWREPTVSDYVGVEALAETVEELPLGARVGLFKQVDGTPARRRWLLSVDFPVGW